MQVCVDCGSVSKHERGYFTWYADGKARCTICHNEVMEELGGNRGKWRWFRRIVREKIVDALEWIADLVER